MIVKNTSAFLWLLKNPTSVYQETWSYPFPFPLPPLTRSLPTFTSWRQLTTNFEQWARFPWLPWGTLSLQLRWKSYLKTNKNKAIPSCASTCWDFMFSNIWRSSREWIRMIRDFFFVQCCHRWSDLNIFRVRINTEVGGITGYETLVWLWDQMSSSLERMLL